MDISREAATTKGPAETFTGEVWVDPITRGLPNTRAKATRTSEGVNVIAPNRQVIPKRRYQGYSTDSPPGG